MLLAGKGPLPKEKRDALYLLLAPNFATDLDEFSPNTLDNPLHLAIHLKDAYTVDIVLEKMKQVQGGALSLLHKHNGSGFTPLMLAFTIFELLGEEADEELQIIKLLLEHGANPNDQNIAHGETPLHLVVRASKNTVALELLCRHSANATLPNKAGQSAIDVAHKSRSEHPEDKWYLFAKRRRLNILKDDHYRPQELVAFLEEEANPDTKDEIDKKKVDNKIVANKTVANKRMTDKKMGDKKDKDMKIEYKKVEKDVDHEKIDGKKVEDKKNDDASSLLGSLPKRTPGKKSDEVSAGRCTLEAWTKQDTLIGSRRSTTQKTRLILPHLPALQKSSLTESKCLEITSRGLKQGKDDEG